MTSRTATLLRRALVPTVAAALLVPLVPAAGAAAAGRGAAAPTATAPTLAAVVPEVAAFVERTRGLRFTRPVKVEALSAAEIERRVVAGSHRPRPPFDTGATLQALHLVPSASRYDDSQAKATASGVLGYYTLGTDTLVVRAAAATPFARGVLAHELTHALQDQVFDLLAVQRRATDADSYAAITSLVEGDARTVERRYRLSLSPADQALYSREVGSVGGGSQSTEARALDAFLSFPYVYGPDLVAALRRAGGQVLLDKAFRAPPESSEQVVAPSRYALLGRRDRPRSLPTPRPPRGANVADSGTLGAYGLAVLLSSKVDRGTRSRAALGWGGDRFVTWRTAHSTCTTLRVLLDTGRDRAELLSALQTWVRGYPGSRSAVTADPRDGRALTLRSCG